MRYTGLLLENNILSLKFNQVTTFLRGRRFMETVSGRSSNRFSVDSSKGVINFPFLSEEANIYVPVKNGETLHLLFTPDNVTGLEQ